MEIFNIILNGIDADNFISLSKEAKRKFILKHTNQRDEKQIHDFICDCKKNKPTEGCFDCKKNNNGNITKTISTEVKPAVELKEDTEEDQRTTSKRSRVKKG